MAGTIPGPVIWSYLVGGVVLAAGLTTIIRKGDWREARGFDGLLLLAPLFYAAPLAAFGTEHFTITSTIASIIPAWMPWHRFWAYLVGACFLAGSFSLVTGIRARLSASLLAMTFFLFVLLMDAPGWLRHPESRFALALVLRELSFSGGALALAVSLAERPREGKAHVLAQVARYFVAVPVLFYGLEQFLHGSYVPGIPLNRVTPTWIWGHAVWTYVVAAVYAVAGTFLVLGRKSRSAATVLGVTVLVAELAVYVPIGIVDRASLGSGLNYLGDTLMYCGALLLVAGAMPREERPSLPPSR